MQATMRAVFPLEAVGSSAHRARSPAERVSRALAASEVRNPL